MVGVDDEIVAISNNGITIRMPVSDISEQGRGATGVRVMNMDDGDIVGSVSPILASEDDESSRTDAWRPRALISTESGPLDGLARPHERQRPTSWRCSSETSQTMVEQRTNRGSTASLSRHDARLQRRDRGQAAVLVISSPRFSSSSISSHSPRWAEPRGPHTSSNRSRCSSARLAGRWTTLRRLVGRAARCRRRVAGCAGPGPDRR